MAATPVGGPTAEAAMSHARYEIDRVAKVNNSIKWTSEPLEKLLPIISVTVTVVMSLYGDTWAELFLCAASRQRAAPRRAAPRWLGGRRLGGVVGVPPRCPFLLFSLHPHHRRVREAKKGACAVCFSPRSSELRQVASVVSVLTY